MSLIKKNRFWIFIVHVLDMPQYILFGNDAQQSAVMCDQGLSQSQFSEHVHHRLHWSLVSDCDRGQIHNLPELEGRGAAAHHWDVLREHAQRVPRQRLEPGPRILKSQEQVPAEHESHQILRFS